MLIEVIVIVFVVVLLVGLFFRKKGDNTMETLSKGFYYLFLLIAIYFLMKDC